jgi:hypothetical protein
LQKDNPALNLLRVVGVLSLFTLKRQKQNKKRDNILV